MANKIVFVCGSPGAGKSSIIESVSKDKRYSIFNVGTLMMESALKKRYVKDRDEIRFLELDKFFELQKKSFGEVSKTNGNVILDTHATIERNGRYLPGIALDHKQYFKGLVALIYIDALTSDITKRRKSDRTRRRENERRELIDVQRLLNISILSSYSLQFDVPLYVVFNEQGKLDDSIMQFKTHLKDIFGV